MMHSASLDRSPRLRRVLDYLSDGRDRSTREIMLGAEVCAVNSCVAELRDNGREIDCRVEVGADGGRVWLYRLRTGQAELPLEAAR